MLKEQGKQGRENMSRQGTSLVAQYECHCLGLNRRARHECNAWQVGRCQTECGTVRLTVRFGDPPVTLPLTQQLLQHAQETLDAPAQEQAAACW